MSDTPNPYASPVATTADHTTPATCPHCGGPMVEGTLRSSTFINWHRSGQFRWFGSRISRFSLRAGAMLVRCQRCIACGYIGIPPAGLSTPAAGPLDRQQRPTDLHPSSQVPLE